MATKLVTSPDNVPGRTRSAQTDKETTTPNTSNSNESPEYSKMRKNYDKLVSVLSPSVVSLARTLFARSLIPQAIMDKMRMSSIPEADKAGELLSHLLSRVEHEPSVFHEFIKALKEHDPSNKMIVETLTENRESHEASPDISLRNREPQNKLRHDSTEPRNVPPEALEVLESIHCQLGTLIKNQAKKTLSADDGDSSSGPQIEWYEDIDTSITAAGRRDVLYIVSNISDPKNQEIVPRRSRGQLTEEERRKLEEQGIHRDYSHTDLAVMTARSALDKRNSVVKVLSAEKVTCEGIKRHIKDFMADMDKEGALLYYVGPGKKGTGDWCFSDGFISFREIMDIYTQHFRGCVLTIVSDCSYSGSWVREAMAFMDEQEVGPCGHVAKERGILVKVLTSCLADEIPAELAFSTHCARNNTSTGIMCYIIDYRSDKIHNGQHPSGLDFTHIQCKNKIDQPCTMAPGSTWQRWSTAERIELLHCRDEGRRAWHYVMLADDEENIRKFKDKIQRQIPGKSTLNVTEYGQIIKSGWGQNPPDEAQKYIEEQYFINYNHPPTSDKPN